MIDSFSKFLSEAQTAISSYDRHLSDMKIREKDEWKKLITPYLRPDHIAYTCNHANVYEKVRAILEASTVSNYIFQSYISGRRITIARLIEPLVTQAGLIDTIELCDQYPIGSEKTPQTNKFDHIETWTQWLPYIEYVRRMESLGYSLVHKVRPHHTTHEYVLPDGFVFRLTAGKLINKVSGEMKIKS